MTDERADGGKGEPSTDSGKGEPSTDGGGGVEPAAGSEPPGAGEFDDVAAAREVVRASPAERDERGLDDDDVRAAFRTVLSEGDREAKDLQGATLPALDFDYEVVDGTNKHPVDLRGAEVESISADEASVRLPFRLEGATVGGLSLEGAHVTQNIALDDATVTGPVDTFEAWFDGDLTATGATFEAPVELDEGTFEDDASFDSATFEAGLTVRNATFHGDSHLLDDSTSFDEARFAEGADFRHTTFGFARFEAATFEDAVRFEEAAFEGDAEFHGARFEGEADFDEVRFGGDASFADATFAARAAFRGTVFEGGARVLEADADFQRTTFEAEAAFDRASFRVADFTEASFAAAANFQAADFDGDATFVDCRFDALADFDEVHFDGDTTFAGTTFAGDADFRGAEFHGAANHLADGVSFADCRFEATADFDDATFTSADFDGVTFGGIADFTGTTFEELHCRASVSVAAAVVDFTGATIKQGQIVQPESAWVRYDLTRASVGTVRLDAERKADRQELLDYFRICETEFDEFDGLAFDFSNHTDYLDRNEWVLHEFSLPADADYEPAEELTPGVTETTYLKAKTAASSAGDMKAAGEFRVKRQTFARRKHLDIARDGSAAPGVRSRNLFRAVENGFLGVTCGHGMRLLRITAAFVLAPLLFVPVYTYGGAMFATNQEGILGNLHLSYISYTTIGYGNAAPTAIGSRLLASSEAYLSTILAALVVYALVKRSEL